MIIEIKRDIHAYVVYVDGRIRRTGFPTKRAAKKWIKEEYQIERGGEG